MNRKAKILYGVEYYKGNYEMVGFSKKECESHKDWLNAYGTYKEVFKARVVRLEVSAISGIVKGKVQNG